MTIWPWAYILVILAFIGVAIYEHINSTALSLPISPYITIITILLPIIAIANAFFYPQLIRSIHRPQRVLARGLQIGQGIFTTVLATLLFSNIVPSAARDCLLSTIWQRHFSNHDSEAIRRIQDAFDCCGLNTVRDRAWPFPNHQSSRSCVETYGRQISCVQPWRRALQNNSGLDFGIVLAIGLFQIASWFLREWFPSVTHNAPPRGMIHYGTNDEPERARLLPGVVGDTGETPRRNGDTPRQFGEGEDDPNTEDRDRGRDAGQSQDNPWG